MKNKKVYDLAMGAMFTAVILLMGLPPVQLGYLKVGMFSITVITIPVAVGAMLMGVKWGTYFGTLFGITSFIYGIVTGEGALMYSVFSTEGAPFYMSILGFLLYGVVTIVPRALVGFGSGMIYKLLKKKGSAKLSVVIASVSAPLLNTILFLSAMVGCYCATPVINTLMELNGKDNVIELLLAMTGLNAVVELSVCTLVSIAAGAFILKMIEMQGKKKNESF